MIIKGKNADWELVIGLETHLQITSKEKLFSSASADYRPGLEPNTHVSDYDLMKPGTKPVLNPECVTQAIKMGLGLNAEITKESGWARKFYSYPDLPAGYQLTQFPDKPPIVGKGFVEITDGDKIKKIYINRAHLEADAAKIKGDLIDLNRLGVALLEIVTEPCMSSPSEVEKYLREIQSIARALGVSDANMEEGSMRTDINISVRMVGEKTFRTKTEIKNMISFKFIKNAIEFEANRQVGIYDQGGQVSQDTMHYNELDGSVSIARSKENATDYGYTPDPDLPPLIITDEEIERIRAGLPELPRARRSRLLAMGLARADAERIGDDNELCKYFDDVLGSRRLPGAGKLAANWILGDIAANPEVEVPAAWLAELIDLISADEVSSKGAKDIFAKLVEGETGTPREIMEKHGLRQVTDTAAVEAAADTIIQAHAAEAEQYRAGKVGLLGFFVGQVMKATGGVANPKVVSEIVAKKLS